MSSTNSLFKAVIWTFVGVVGFTFFVTTMSGWSFVGLVVVFIAVKSVVDAFTVESGTKALNATELEDNATKAYLSCLATMMLISFALLSMFEDEWFVFVVLNICATIAGISTAFHASELSKLEEATVEAKDLHSSVASYLHDYRTRKGLNIDLRLFSTKDETGLHRVEFYDNEAGSVDILLGSDTHIKTWWTTSGRVIELHKLDQWAFVLDETKKKVTIYESKVHSN